MNHNDRKLLGELKEGIKRSYQDILEIKKDVRSLVKGHYKQEEKMTGLDIQFKNHLKHHEEQNRRNEKQIKLLIVGLTTIITVVGLLVGLGVI